MEPFKHRIQLGNNLPNLFNQQTVVEMTKCDKEELR